MALIVTRLSLSHAPLGNLLVPIAATASPGTPIHTAVIGVDSVDIITLFVSNVTAAPALLTIEWGGTGVGNHLVHDLTISANSTVQVIAPGLTIINGILIAAFSSVAGALNISGHVDQISQSA